MNISDSTKPIQILIYKCYFSGGIVKLCVPCYLEQYRVPCSLFKRGCICIILTSNKCFYALRIKNIYISVYIIIVIITPDTWIAI